MLKKNNLALLFIDKKNYGRQILGKKVGSTPKIRVGRVTGNKQFFCFGLNKLYLTFSDARHLTFKKMSLPIHIMPCLAL